MGKCDNATTTVPSGQEGPRRSAPRGLHLEPVVARSESKLHASSPSTLIKLDAQDAQPPTSMEPMVREEPPSSLEGPQLIPYCSWGGESEHRSLGQRAKGEHAGTGRVPTVAPYTNAFALCPPRLPSGSRHHPVAAVPVGAYASSTRRLLRGDHHASARIRLFAPSACHRKQQSRGESKGK